MCLGVPGKIIELYETEGLKMGKPDVNDGVIADLGVWDVYQAGLPDHPAEVHLAHFQALSFI